MATQHEKSIDDGGPLYPVLVRGSFGETLA